MSRPESAFLSSQTGNHIAVITLSRPPAGWFWPNLRAALFDALTNALTAPETDAIVLASEGAGFNLDLPLAERQLGQSAPSLDALTDLISTAPKPVVAALRGRLSDAGAELALAAHARVAHRASVISLPTLPAGQLPSPAACYTLAAKLGPQSAMKLLQTLRDTPITLPELAPLFDRFVGQNVVGEAADLAQTLRQSAPPAALTAAFAAPLRYQSELDALRRPQNTKTPQPETTAAIDVLEAARLLPKEAALLYARSQTTDLANTPSARRKTYTRAARLAALRHTPESRPPASLTLVGTGKQALTLTLMALRASLPVKLLALEADSFAAFHQTVARELDSRVARHALTAAQAARALALLSELPDFASLKAADCIIECAPPPASRPFETLRDLLGKIRTHAGEAPLLFLTSAVRSGAAEFLDLMSETTAALQSHPDIGGGTLAELALAPDFARSAASQGPMRAALKRLGVPALFQSAQNGLVSARLFTAFCLAAEEAVAQGASPAAVDQAQLSRVTPFAAQNAEGQRAQPFRLHAFFEDRLQSHAPGLNAAFLQAGLDGGKGRSAFDPDKTTLTHEAQAAVAQWREHLGQTGYTPDAAPPTADDIRFLTTAALYVEGERLLKAGVVATPWEIDQIANATLGLAPEAAGPFFEVSTLGLASFLARLRRIKPLRPEFFTAPPELSERIKNGETFATPGQDVSSGL
ncbi:MAG: enoyl-CoA hydratase/isomerase family protein [Roseobacter sp.]|nr:enoyl-CoA hydratase/isomerase family protein [Roseobacter sp.]